MRIRRIQSSLIQSFAILIVFTIVLLGGVSIYFFKKTLVGTTEQNTMQLVSQLNRVIDTYIAYMDDIALVLVNNADVRAYIESPLASPEPIRRRIEQFLGSVKTVRKDIDGIFLLPSARPGIAVGPEARNSLILAASPGAAINPDFDFLERYGSYADELESRKVVVTSTHVENVLDDRYTWVISLLRRLKIGDREGYVMVDLNYAIIKDLCRDIRLGKSGYVFIIDHGGDIVYHPLQQLVYGGLKSEDIAGILRLQGGYLPDKVDGREILYTAADSSQTGWTVVAVSYMDELFAGFREAEYSFVMLALFCVFVATAVASLISMRISQPIESLRKSMQQVEGGVFDIDISVNCSNEVSQLAYDCNIALKTVRELLEQNRKDGELKRVLELRALQAQINPHFLYNTLEAINWKAKINKVEEISDMVSALSTIIEANLNRNNETFISVSKEAEYIENYNFLIRKRFGSKIRFTMAIEDAAMNHPIPKLLVQPIIENAIYHGLEMKKGGGSVEISITKEEELLVIRVSDDGLGIEEERLRELKELMADNSFITEGSAGAGHSSSKIGVINVHRRIQLLYGEEYGLDIASEPGNGTTVTIRIPVNLPKGDINHV